MTQHLPCYNWLLNEIRRYGSQWTKSWAQEQALKTVSSYLPELLHDHVHIVDHVLYPRWSDFLQNFISSGGLIEGVPPSDSITPLSVDILIEPTGQVKVLCTLDQACYFLLLL